MCMTLRLCTAVGRGKSTGLESDMVRELAKILKSKLLTDRIAAGTTHTDTSLLDVSSCICRGNLSIAFQQMAHSELHSEDVQ